MMFAQAQSIIGVHGSGLANLIFCAPGTQAIEINPPEGHCGPYSSLAKTLKLSYQQLNSKAAGLTKEQLQKDDIIVPVETLQAMLN